MQLKLPKALWLLAFALFCFLTIPETFSEGMFMDGLYYSSISRNMAEGIGTPAEPYFTAEVLPVFHDHPPLAFYLQGACFWVFGDSLLVERFYSFFMVLLCLFLVGRLWLAVGMPRKLVWLPTLLWVVVPDVYWATANNLLENTMGVFICLSALAVLRSLHKNNARFIYLGGLALALAVLTKGFVSLYVWTIPLAFFVVGRGPSLRIASLRTAQLVLATVLPIAALLLLSSDALQYFTNYLDGQVGANLAEPVSLTKRVSIVKDFLQQSLVPLGLAVAITLVAIAANITWKPQKQLRTVALSWLLVVLAGVLPIMISGKQSRFYIVTVYPFLAIAIGVWLKPIALHFVERFEANKRLRLGIVGVAAVLLLLVPFRLASAGRDEAVRQDCKQVIELVGEGNLVRGHTDLLCTWSLHTYLQRLGHVSMVADSTHVLPVQLWPKGSAAALDGVELIPLNTVDITVARETP